LFLIRYKGYKNQVVKKIMLNKIIINSRFRIIHKDTNKDY